MFLRLRTRKFFVMLFPILFAACTSELAVDDLFSDTLRGVDSKGKPLKSRRAGSRQIGTGGKNAPSFTGISHQGEGSFISSKAPPVYNGTTLSGEQGFTINLVDAPINIASKNILSDILGYSYIVDPRVSGTITLQTTNPVTKDAVIEIFETTLALNEAGLIRRGDQYHIVPISEAIKSTPQVSVPSVSPRGPGIKVQVVELRYISAEEMKTILEPISREGSILRIDKNRNYLVLAGNNSELASMTDAVSVFDVDWMKGMSVALHPLKTSRPSDIAQELENIFKTEGGPGADLVQFIPNDRLNSVLVITSRPVYLQRAAIWIKKLDRIASNNEDQLFVYEIQNRPVSELAEVLQSVLSGETNPNDEEQVLAPDITPVLLDSNQEEGFDPVDQQVESSRGVSASNANGVSIVADADNNALLISTTPLRYKRIEQILKQIDVLPTQVLLEAIIAEVTLNDELNFGVRWAIENGNFSFGLSDLASGFIGAQFPGFNVGFKTNDIQITLKALASITDVNVISSPTLMALNNQKAVLQVGDQVPVITQQATGIVTANAPVVNSVELKDTGIILSVIPRVNKSGRVMLNIEQEVSSVVNTTTSGIDSPTIRQRKISTRVIVNDGESLALGGLIQERNELNRDQIPILGDIPFLGNAFKDKKDTINRTELIIFIRPRVIRNINEARDVTSEFRKKLSFKSAINARRGGKSELEQNLKRINN